MPDIYATFEQLSPQAQEATFAFLEARAADPARRAILDAYLAAIAFPPDARVLEVGCGTGSIARILARWPGVGHVVGIDPWESFIAKARELGAGIANLSFEQGDGHAMPFADRSFDAAIFHTTLLHMRDPAAALAEAHRVLRAEGWVSILDPDPQATSFAIAPHDPLQAVWEAAMGAMFLNPWLSRQLPGLVRAAGFELVRAQSYGTVETKDTAGVLTLLDGAADTAAEMGLIGAELAAALKNEARRRIDAGTFVRIGANMSLIAKKAA